MSEVSLVDGHIDNEMTYLEELLQRNPLVFDGDKIRPHHKYADDLYTGSKSTMTNYDRIKSMSVDEMAEFLMNSDQICFDTCKKATGNKFKCPFKDDGDVLKHCFGCYFRWLNSEVSDND